MMIIIEIIETEYNPFLSKSVTRHVSPANSTQEEAAAEGPATQRRRAGTSRSETIPNVLDAQLGQEGNDALAQIRHQVRILGCGGRASWSELDGLLLFGCYRRMRRKGRKKAFKWRNRNLRGPSSSGDCGIRDGFGEGVS